ncbi:MAG TPA: hypothetical protein DHW63_11840 [Hyphomonadaceae bacterium]|nr:hypothetical protein [Hyphomonadaceae bacterium]
MALPPSLDDLEALTREAWDGLPQAFRALAGSVVFRIQDWPEEDLLAEMEIDDALDLTGLYQGVDLTQASIEDPAPPTPMVFLYRRPILEEWVERGDIALPDLVAHILIHEIGHHFGLSDEAMDALLEGEH